MSSINLVKIKLCAIILTLLTSRLIHAEITTFSLPKNNETRAEILIKADQVLAQAKKNGQCVQLFLKYNEKVSEQHANPTPIGPTNFLEKFKTIFFGTDEEVTLNSFEENGLCIDRGFAPNFKKQINSRSHWLGFQLKEDGLDLQNLKKTIGLDLFTSKTISEIKIMTSKCHPVLTQPIEQVFFLGLTWDGIYSNPQQMGLRENPESRIQIGGCQYRIYLHPFLRYQGQNQRKQEVIIEEAVEKFTQLIDKQGWEVLQKDYQPDQIHKQHVFYDKAIKETEVSFKAWSNKSNTWLNLLGPGLRIQLVDGNPSACAQQHNLIKNPEKPMPTTPSIPLDPWVITVK